ncbi:hypothetical protein D8674_029852 [Pyrus ussuriensis x Pyrus communis]|uniref:Uncharacterized protein n=1 Tax=Pyrus ussuriensis x Pyrus communis TaxID=2448454 RepID=A0A5N5I086_9ROSA|nr:hypothetical protein D8674_029852 [Pyrus ussuriensis x Pyrus communis]
MGSADEGKRLSPPSSSPSASLPTFSDTLHPASTTETAPKTPTTLQQPDQDNNVVETSDPGFNQITLPGVEHGDGTRDSDTRKSPAATTPCGVDIAGKGSSGSGRLDPSNQLNELRTDPITALGEANTSTVGENLSYSQVSDCSEAFELGANAATDEDFAAYAGTEPAQDVQPNDGLEGSHSQPTVDASGSATQSPPTQVMERPGDPASSPYRIPDYVFARNKSTSPMEWSPASNESLFSIQMGNMSFTRDEINWLCKSGELGLPGEVSYLPSGPCSIDFTSNQPPAKQTAQSAENASDKKGNVKEEPSLRATEAKAVETMREVIRENAESREKEKAPIAGEGGKYHSACLSHVSDGSTKSFAFPILAGDGDINVSLRGEGAKHKHQPGSRPTSQRQSRSQTPEETPEASSQASKPTPIEPKCRWGLSCFSCCPSCCT